MMKVMMSLGIILVDISFCYTDQYTRDSSILNKYTIVLILL